MPRLRQRPGGDHRRCCWPCCAPATPSCCPPTATTRSGRSPRRRCAELGVDGRSWRRPPGRTRRSTASGWCCWRRRPTRAWTCATSPRWPRPRTPPGALVAVDNTTATPLGQRPLDLGADLVVASGTKALTGHSDLLLGYVATRDAELLAAARAPGARSTGGDPGRVRRLAGAPVAGHAGPAAGPADRERGGGRRAAARRDPTWTAVRWPGLPDDPSYAVAAAQMRRIPGVVTFDLGTAERGGPVPHRRPRWSFAATSFGGLHTTGRPAGPVGRRRAGRLRAALLRHRGHRPTWSPTSRAGAADRALTG